MAAGIHEPTGNTAGRVTIWTTFASLIPPFAAIFVVVICALLEILDKETAGAVVLGILATAGLTTSAVFTTAKKTPTDQARLIWGSVPVPDAVTLPPVAIPAPEAQEADEDIPAPEIDAQPPAPAPAETSLAEEVDAVRARRSGSTAGGLA